MKRYPCTCIDHDCTHQPRTQVKKPRKPLASSETRDEGATPRSRHALPGVHSR